MSYEKYIDQNNMWNEDELEHVRLYGKNNRYHYLKLDKRAMKRIMSFRNIIEEFKRLFDVRFLNWIEVRKEDKIGYNLEIKITMSNLESPNWFTTHKDEKILVITPTSFYVVDAYKEVDDGRAFTNACQSDTTRYIDITKDNKTLTKYCRMFSKTIHDRLYDLYHFHN